MWNPKNNTNEFIYKTEKTHRQKQAYNYQHKRGEKERQIGSVGLIDTHYYI